MNDKGVTQSDSELQNDVERDGARACTSFRDASCSQGWA